MQGSRHGIIGPTLLDVAAYTGASITVVSLTYTVSSTAALLGSLTLNPLLDRFNSHVLTGVTTLLVGIALIASPWIPNIYVYIVTQALSSYVVSTASAGYKNIVTLLI